MSWPTSARVLGLCGLAASLLLTTRQLEVAGGVMAVANVYALVRG